MNINDTENDLKFYRKKRGLTQVQVADALNISSSHYCNMERKKRGMDYRTAKTLARFYRISLEQVFECSLY